jgi:hypothetical protein
MKLRLWAPAIAATVAIVGTTVALSQAGAGATPMRDLHVQEHIANAMYVPVQALLGSKQSSNQGDYETFDDPLFGVGAAAKQVGHIMGTCWLEDVTAGSANDTYFCTVDLFLGDSQLSGVGPFDVNGTPTTAPITGGTGSFADARGQITVRGISQTVNDFVIDIDR